MIDGLARELAEEIRHSQAYETYAAARERVMADEQTWALLRRFHALQMKVQARRMAEGQGGPEEEEPSFDPSRAEPARSWPTATEPYLRESIS